MQGTGSGIFITAHRMQEQCLRRISDVEAEDETSSFTKTSAGEGSGMASVCDKGPPSIIPKFQNRNV